MLRLADSLKDVRETRVVAAAFFAFQSNKPCVLGFGRIANHVYLAVSTIRR